MPLSRMRTKPSQLFMPDEKEAGGSPNVDVFHVVCSVAERSARLISYDPLPPPPPLVDSHLQPPPPL